MRTNYKHITAADQRLIKQMAAQAISPLPKRMRDSEKEAILTYFPARFKDYRVTNIVAHIRMWQIFPADTFAQHQARMTAKHTSSHFGLFQETKEYTQNGGPQEMSRKDVRLREMTPTCALFLCIELTWQWWKPLESAEVLELLAVYREYILSGFDADRLNVPAGRVADAWAHCRVIIDKEITQ